MTIIFTLKNYAANNVALIRFPCISKIDTLHILKAVSLGVDGVLVVGCREDEKFQCPFHESEFWAGKRIGHAQKLLQEMGLEEDRIIFSKMPALDTGSFKQIVAEAEAKLSALGPSPFC